MGADAFGQEFGHFEIRISEQGREIVLGSYYLRKKGTVAVADEYIGGFLLA